MTKDDIIRMAREAGFAMENSAAIQAAESFHALATEAEREAILSKATKARAVDGNCAIVLAADIRTRSTP